MRKLTLTLVCVLLNLLGASAAAQPSGQRSLPAIRSQAEFDSLAVVYDANTPYALPHVLFAI
ncbi:MAG: hypothetical protein QOI77_2928, partial [Blastocatellia bacterium]|nr:hypothetical protein [Blastocatellia bacterium]